MDHRIFKQSLQVLQYMEAHKQGARQKLLDCSLDNIKRSRSKIESSVRESLILFASFNLRRRRKLCQGGVDNGDNDETRLLNHGRALSDD